MTKPETITREEHLARIDALIRAHCLDLCEALGISEDVDDWAALLDVVRANAKEAVR